MWTLAFGDRTPTHGYAETREGAMAAFAKRWRRRYNTIRPRHRSDTSRQHRRYSSLPSPRGRLHYANRLRRTRQHNGRP